tara:strand:+ start:329 stop:514 length:186 start_codon:yes stop_codon:yes gene_type:complete
MTINDKIYNELQNVIIENCTVCYMPTTKKDLEYYKKLYDIEVCEQCVINAIIKIFCKGVFV